MKKLLFTVAAIALVAQSIFAQSATNVAETDLLLHIFQNAAVDSIGDATGLPASSTADSLYVALLTQSPTESGTMTNECAYTSYGRIGVVRSSSGWTVSNDSAWNTAAVTFPQATGGTETASHFAILWRNKVYFWGQLASNLSISSGVTPRFSIKNLIVTLN